MNEPFLSRFLQPCADLGSRMFVVHYNHLFLCLPSVKGERFQKNKNYALLVPHLIKHRGTFNRYWLKNEYRGLEDG